MSKVIVLYPGGFKPLHGGHLDLIERYHNLDVVKEIKLLVGSKERNGITPKDAIEYAHFFLEQYPKVTIKDSIYPSPLLTAFKEVENAKNKVFTLATSTKGKDYERSIDFIDKHQPGQKYHDKLDPTVKIVRLSINNKPLLYKGRNDEFENKPISSTVLRNDIKSGNIFNFWTNYPLISNKIKTNTELSKLYYTFKEKLIQWEELQSI